MKNILKKFGVGAGHVFGVTFEPLTLHHNQTAGDRQHL